MKNLRCRCLIFEFSEKDRFVFWEKEQPQKNDEREDGQRMDKKEVPKGITGSALQALERQERAHERTNIAKMVADFTEDTLQNDSGKRALGDFVRFLEKAKGLKKPQQTAKCLGGVIVWKKYLVLVGKRPKKWVV